MSYTTNLGLPLMPDTPEQGVTGFDLRKMINGENEDSMAQILDKIIEPNTNKATAVDNATIPDDDNKFPTCALVNKALSNIGNVSLEKTVIFEKQTISGFSDGNTGYTGLEGVLLPIVDGETYIVNWDGVDYECVAGSLVIDGISSLFLGNVAIGNSDFENTGEPFAIATVSFEGVDMTSFISENPTEDSHTVAIYQEKIGNYLTTEDKEELIKLILDNELFSNNEMTFTHLSTINRYTWHQIGSSAINFIPGETYYVEWDGKFYKCIAGSGSMGGDTYHGIGNTTLVGIGEDTGEPFGIVYNLEVPQNMFVSNDTKETTHSVKIYQKVSSGTSTESGSSLPEVTESDNGKHLEVENGVWTVKEIKTTEQVQADWDETNIDSPAYIKNKPVISGDGGASVQANWEQTDETQADFIKNKPFYEYEGLEELLPLTQYDRFYLDSIYGIYTKKDYPIFTLTIGETYIASWDGVDYECVAQDASIIMTGAIVLGNVSAFGLSGNNEPFIIAVIPESGVQYFSLTDREAGGSHSVRICQERTLIKHLNNKYLDFMSCELKDIEVFPLTQHDRFYLEESYGVYGYACSDILELTVGETYVVTWDGVNYECVAQDASAIQSGVIGIGNGAAFGLSGNNEPFVIAVIPNTGAQYFSLTDTEAGGSHSIRIRQCGVEIVTVDSEFIENISWDKISDKPFGDISAGTVIVPERTAVLTGQMDTNYYGIVPNMGLSKHIHEGGKYLITFNGTVYESIVGIDDRGTIGVGYIDEENGFYLLIADNYAGTSQSIVLASVPMGSYTYSISYGEDVIQTIDPKYIPKIDGLPEVSTNDNNKVMTVVDGKWIAQTPASGLPDVTTSDNEKVLKVVNGAWTVSNSLPSVTSEDAGKFLRVSSDGTWIVETIQNVSEVGL